MKMLMHTFGGRRGDLGSTLAVLLLAIMLMGCERQNARLSHPAVEPRVVIAPPLSVEAVISEQEAQDLVARFPESATAYYELARTLHLQKRFVEATPLFQKCIQLDPLRIDCYWGLSDCYRYSQPPKWEQAESVLRDAFVHAYTSETRAVTCINLGNLYLDRHSLQKLQNDVVLARNQYIEALKHQNRSSSAAYGVGITFARQQQYTEASQWFERAVEWARTPREKAKALEALANAVATLGDRERARQLIEEARQVNPHYPATLWDIDGKTHSE